ncbi:MAG: TetR/AcrR family transcriptional regulator [Actinomycetota bacterium]|nr:TetR/AcrR family transcriptional regulator [Actinomycetota bacterium]
MSPRATALPPGERRARLVDAARDLIAARGTVPTTREIAEAAGVAEGTIFRVFQTKDDLVDAVAASAFCPALFRRGLDAVDIELPLRERLIALVTLLQQRFVDVFGLMAALGLTVPPAFPPDAHEHCSPELGHVGVVPRVTDAAAGPRGVRPVGRSPEKDHHHEDDDHRALEMLRYLEPDAGRLRCPPGRLLHYVRLLTFAGSHQHLADGVLLTPDEIVDVLLTGVLVPDEPAAQETPATRPTCPTRKAS